MSKSNAPDANDHWKRLAAQLGLEMDPEPEPPAPPEPELASPPPTEQPESVVEVVVSETLGVWTTESHEFVMAPPIEDEREPEVIAVESERLEAATDEFGEPRPEPTADEKPRRRRRTRRRKGDDAPAESAEAGDQPRDDDDSPVDIVKDWDIPSWNDLIASLYRPER